ncbi:MAG: hypothetical protein JWM11_7554, partial [Planctomycetaceae bacterium]|nr:hypothetical protein [Planctomycetaceae bacterium]
MSHSPSHLHAASANDIAAFINRWQQSAAAERANYQLFLTELCEILGVAKPEPTRSKIDDNSYVFERDVTFQNLDGTTSIGRIDLYKRSCFVLEAKQGSEQVVADEFRLSPADAKASRTKKGTAVRGTKGWDDAMFKARGQAEQYARALPVSEGWPTFLIVVDVGHTIELFADFTRSGKTYLPFPDPGTHRIKLDKLTDSDVILRLQTVWTEPLSLDPSRRSAKVTRELAERLARLAKSLEGTLDSAGRKCDPRRVAQFLMRCLFTMFAEDVELLPGNSFTELLHSLQDDIAAFPDMVQSLWESMDKGTFSPILRKKLRQFNGGLFEDCEALPLRPEQLQLLIEASKANWREVEPAIFGTLLERALDPIERHKLGAHYTPRAYVERLVMPTIIEPLREEWDAVRAAAVTLANRGDKAAAIEEVREFLARLCNTEVLDPACGSGNFLYVALEHMKRLEGEVLNTLGDLGGPKREFYTVDPHQFLGIEVNPRAAAIADLVLWIGYLQWHIRTRDLSDISEPIIRKFHNIECRDAVLAWDSVEPVVDADGKPVTRWDGRTMKKHPVTGEDVPDDSARVQELKYVNPRQAAWPRATYIIGNPPFVGNKKMREALGDGYASTLRAVYSQLPETCDYVMYWWERAGDLVRTSAFRRFGFITTNSITQTFNRAIVDRHISAGLSLVFAIPDHPWVDSTDGAAVRIAMTVGEQGNGPGILRSVCSESTESLTGTSIKFTTSAGQIHANLTIGANTVRTKPLKSNSRLVFQGCKLVGAGFQVSPEKAMAWERDDPSVRAVFRSYWSGTDLTRTRNERFVIDFFGFTIDEARESFPSLYQHLHDTVLPERLKCQRKAHRDNWWLFGEKRPAMRTSLASLSRYIATSEVAKHRVFVFLPWPDSLPDGSLAVIAHSDAFVLGVLSSKIHVVFALRAGGRMGVGNDPRYQNGPCFDPFPFPSIDELLKRRIRELAEKIDLHRKRQQSVHPDLMITGMYNVLEKLRSGEALTAKEKVIHEQGLVSVLKQLHDELDAAVFEAYGWPVTLTDEEILERLVALNAERAAEEQQGLIRWLRPEFQNPAVRQETQATIEFTEPEEPDEEEVPTTAKKGKGKGQKQPATTAVAGAPVTSKKIPWPKSLPEQIQTVRQHLLTATRPVLPTDLAQNYTRANLDRIAEVLESLVIIGSARQLQGGAFV